MNEAQKLGIKSKCGSYLAACKCMLEPHDKERHHECECGGQWQGSDEHGDAVPKKLPVRGGLLDVGFGLPSNIKSILDNFFGDPQ